MSCSTQYLLHQLCRPVSLGTGIGAAPGQGAGLGVRCRGLLGALAACALSCAPVLAAPVDTLHILIPGGPGGGWDRTGRVTGDVLRRAGLVGTVSFANMSGGGGGRAIGYMIETAQHRHATLLVNSVPILVRSITEVLPYSFRDLTPIAAVIGDYGALAVRPDSPFASFDDALAAFRAAPDRAMVAGGSVCGDLDHIVAALALAAAGEDPQRLIYVPYDTGGKALAGILSGEAPILSTGFGEALEQARAGRLRILAVTAPDRLPGAADVPTLRELGYDAEFANWRGFFGPPALPEALAERYADMFQAMYRTPEWQAARRQNGWTDLFIGRAAFLAFLEAQEKTIRTLRRDLGFR